MMRREVRYQQREQGGAQEHAMVQALAQRHAAQYAVGVQRGGGAGHLLTHARALVAAAQREAYDDEAGQKRRAALADEGQG